MLSGLCIKQILMCMEFECAQFHSSGVSGWVELSLPTLRAQWTHVGTLEWTHVGGHSLVFWTNPCLGGPDGPWMGLGWFLLCTKPKESHTSHERYHRRPAGQAASGCSSTDRSLSPTVQRFERRSLKTRSAAVVREDPVRHASAIRGPLKIASLLFGSVVLGAKEPCFKVDTRHHTNTRFASNSLQRALWASPTPNDSSERRLRRSKRFLAPLQRRRCLALVADGPTASSVCHGTTRRVSLHRRDELHPFSSAPSKDQSFHEGERTNLYPKQ